MSEWQRLDRRMLLVHPLRELVRFLPALLALFVVGSASSGPSWQYVGVAVPIVLGVLRYVTTGYRITGGRVELRRGLLNRRVLSTPLDRVRTVDLTSPLTHRLLGLTTVRVGSGTGDDEGAIDLDGLPLDHARRLRAELLRRSPDGSESGPAHDDLVLRLDPWWARFAPFTSTGLALGAAAVGVAWQGLTTVGGPRFLDLDDLLDDAARASLLVAVPLALLLVLLATSALAVGGYLVGNWGLTLRHPHQSWHLARGLFTTRETTLDEARVAGVSLGQPLGLRLAGGAHLSAIVTGVDRSESGSAMLVPPAPYAVAAGVAGRVIGTDEPLRGPLVGHGPAAARRRWSRALGPALLVLAVGVLLVVVGEPVWVLAPGVAAVPVAAVLAADRARALGHALAAGHLVARSGSLTRRREALGTDHVIGWTFRDTWLQRRAGLTTLIATTAGGRGSVTVPDVPLPDAERLAALALPGLVAQFAE